MLGATVGRHLLTMGIAILSSSVIADQLEQMLVTGAYSPIGKSGVSSSVSIVDSDQIRALNKRRVVDLLRTLPGVLIEEQGGAGGMAAVSIRGGETNFTVVLIDGVQVNDPTNSRGGSFDFSMLNVNSIDRIEVIRGPQSAVYGSDALSGVINIITRRPALGHQQRVAIEYGEDGYASYHGQAMGSNGKVSYSVQAEIRDGGESIEGSTNDNSGLNMALGWDVNGRNHIRIHYRHIDGDRTSFPEQSGGPKFAVLRDLETSDYADRSAGLNWRYQVSEYWISRLALTRFEHEDVFYSPGIYPFTSVPPYESVTEFDRTQYQWINTLGVPGEQWLNIGADHRAEDGSSEGEIRFLGETDFALNRNSTGLFVDANARLNGQLLVSMSIRADDAANEDMEVTRRLGARYLFNDTLTLVGNWGEGFKLPSFFALGYGIIANPDLKPERAESWDLGLEIIPTAGMEFNIFYFQNHYTDLIDFDPARFTNVNRSSVDTQGVEMAMRWRPAATIEIDIHATYTDIDVVNNESTLTGRPQWKGGVVSRWDVTPKVQAVLDWSWTGEQFAGSLHTGSTTISTLAAHHRMDLGLDWRVVENVSVKMVLENIADEDYAIAVGMNALGRLFRMGVTWYGR